MKGISLAANGVKSHPLQSGKGWGIHGFVSYRKSRKVGHPSVGKRDCITNRHFILGLMTADAAIKCNH
jgi:hypothetical protein